MARHRFRGRLGQREQSLLLAPVVNDVTLIDIAFARQLRTTWAI
jgi:hypothetical protein